jgi:hypothetical protein
MPKNIFRSWGVGVEHCGCAHRHGQIHAVAEAVSEEEPCRRKADVVLREMKNPSSEGLGGHHHVILGVDRSFR